MKTKVTKLIALFVLFVISASVYAGLIAFANHYLRENDLLSPVTKGLLTVVLVFGLYYMWKWLCRRLDEYNKGSNY